MRILVVCGGVGDERAVSLVSGARVFEALASAGHDVTLYDDRGEGALGCLALAKETDAVFMALHGGAGEDGTWQSNLERAGVFHYTGSAPAACALAMHKDAAKRRVETFGMNVAKGRVLSAKTTAPPLPYPFVAKPLSGGSSVGLCFVRCRKDWQKFTPLGDFLCEKYLSGREYSVGILQGEPLPAVEIRAKDGEYDYVHKYTAGASEEICPAPISRERAAQLAALARTAFVALGLRDYARIDFREDEEGVPHFLEANALPGMTQTSLFPLAASVAGLDLSALCHRMCCLAAARRAAH